MHSIAKLHWSIALEVCCQAHFHWDITGCISASGGAVSDMGTRGELFLNGCSFCAPDLIVLHGEQSGTLDGKHSDGE